MAILQQFSGRIYLDNAGGTLTDIGANGTSFMLNVTNTTATYNVLNTPWTKATDGPRSWSIDCELIAETGTNGYSLIRDWVMATSPGARTVRIDQPDSSTGSQRYEGECRISNANGLLNANASAGDPVRVTFTLTGDGQLTPSIVA
jgi:hypothetical protein